jgi:molybdenum-dependent DNA-binding transcriptional regulator ModE
MNYNEAIKEKITGETTELDRRRELWKEIVSAYEQGGEDAIKSVLTKHSDRIINEFDRLLEQLRKKS